MLKSSIIFRGVSALARSSCTTENAICYFACKRNQVTSKALRHTETQEKIPYPITKFVQRTLRTRAHATTKPSAPTWDEMIKDIDSAAEPPNRRPQDVVKTISKDQDKFKIEKSDHSVARNERSLVTGMDIAKQLRQKRKNKSAVAELDPVKRAIRAFQVPDYTYEEDELIAKHIRRRVVYADKNMVIFNKPYGLPIHDGDGLKKNIKRVLPMVSRMVHGISTNIPLALCNRLDKNTTGVIVCCADPELEKHIKKMFRMHLICKKVWAIVIGVPQPQEGIIDIPIGEGHFTDRNSSKKFSRMVAKPNVRYDPMTGEETPQSIQRGQRAITKYRVIDYQGEVSLVEFEPETTAKHQIRVHAADGLGCPILGDHKYSELGSLAPQKLSPLMLKRLQLPSTKTRHIPMHLHQSQILIPDVFKDQRKRHLVVGSRVPAHFERSMKLFGLRAGVPSPWNVKRLPPPDLEAPPADFRNPLYHDPTVESTEERRESGEDGEKDCVFVFRPQVNVKYKKFY